MHVCRRVLIPACCRPPVSFILSLLRQLILLSLAYGNRWACLFCVRTSKQISQECPVNTAKTDPSWRAFPWASNKRENKELILDETQKLFI